MSAWSIIPCKHKRSSPLTENLNEKRRVKVFPWLPVTQRQQQQKRRQKRQWQQRQPQQQRQWRWRCNHNNLNLLLSKCLPKVAHHTCKLLTIDETIPVLEGGQTFLLFLRKKIFTPSNTWNAWRISSSAFSDSCWNIKIITVVQLVAHFQLDESQLSHLQRHHAEELGEVDHAGAILVHLQIQTDLIL